jgi:hypothetical protein
LCLPAIVLGGSCALESFNQVDQLPSVASSSSSSSGTGGQGGQGGAGGGTASGECVSAQFPTRPSDATPGGDEDFVVAVRSVTFESSDSAAVGIDLDRTCTCLGDGPSCVAPPGAAVGAECDLERGRDNAIKALFSILEVSLMESDLAQFYSDAAENGNWTMLMRVKDYNGEPDDEQVKFMLYIPAGFRTLNPDPAYVPKWDGADVWPVSRGSLEGGQGGAGGSGGGLPALSLEQPIYFDANAFVADGWLVASLPKSELRLAGNSTQITLALSGGGMMARLQKTFGRWLMRDGVIASKILHTDLFEAMSSYRDKQGNPFCRGDTTYAFAKPILCNSLDIYTGADQGPTDECNSISAGLGFEAEQVQFGPVLQVAGIGGGCPAMQDPSGDFCIQ